MLLLEQIVAVITIGNLILAAVLIFMERRNIAATWAWLMVLLFLPGIGFLLYLIFGQRLSKKSCIGCARESFPISVRLSTSRRSCWSRASCR